MMELEKKKNSKRKYIAMLVALAVCCITLGGVYAWKTLNTSITNEITTPTVEVEIVEEFDPSTEVDWNDPVIKKVSFKNTGTADAFIRVSYAEFWKEVVDETENLLPNFVDGKEVATKNWTEYWIDGSSSEWVDGKDGWYYYKKVLPADGSTNLILNSVSFDSEFRKEYENADYSLKFSLEAVQYSSKGDSINKDALEKSFGKKYTNIDDSGNITWNN